MTDTSVADRRFRWTHASVAVVAVVAGVGVVVVWRLNPDEFKLHVPGLVLLEAARRPPQG